MDDANSTGLSSEEALSRLRMCILNELKSCNCMIHGRKGLVTWASDCFSRSSMSSTFRWPSILIGLFCAVFFVTSFFDTHDVSHLFQSVLVVAVLIVNVCVIGWDTKKYHNELHDKARDLAEKIDRELLSNESDLQAWTSGKFFPQLYLPHSPCISLQWTFRDGKVVNVPTSLLVTGDIIKLCPGTPAPGLCQNIQPDGNKNDSQMTLKAGELFVPVVDSVPSDFTGARFRKTVSPVKFVMKETPFVAGLKLSLEKSWSRPRSLYDKERHEIIAKYIECMIIPAAALLLIIVCLTRYSHFRDKDSNVTWTEVNRTLLRMSLVIFPLVPFSLPISWIVLNALGVDRLHYLVKQARVVEGPTARLTRVVTGKLNTASSFFDDIDTEMGSDVNETLMSTSTERRPWKELLNSVLSLLQNKEGIVWRSGNLVQALGSMTALCCIDKKGILSWPNPTADKVFFLTGMENKGKAKDCSGEIFSPQYSSHGSQEGSQSIGGGDDKGDDKSDSKEPGDANINCPNTTQPEAKRKARKRTKGKKQSYPRYQSRPQVLDLTQDPHSASLCMEFDDVNWHRFLPNLKPLGLGILVNTCNPEAQADYTRFSDHITCESFNNEVAVPVVNKRCLCELSLSIGFTNSAVQNYEYLFEITMFRHVKHHHVKKNLLNIPRLKMPFPHVASALIKESSSNTFQLFSQGTGDLILDACTEFWDGSHLKILTNADRKRILDFYHRSSLTAYCMAFSYVPLTSVSPGKCREIFKEHTLELPPDSGNVLGRRYQLNQNALNEEREDSQTRLSGRYLSNESLTMTEPEEDIDADDIAAQINNQVFIGMVTMEYQACPDFVQLVEQLEKACIRFVHFSKENELRSRVFSEKMGLESGWNCHISLGEDEEEEIELSRDGQPNHEGLNVSKISLLEPPSAAHPSSILRSQSAPCTVNVEAASIVKFVEQEKDSDASNNLLSSDTESSTSESSSSSSVPPKTKSSSTSDNVSPSRVTDSTATETTPFIAFDVLNRAKLPKGIKKIVPHLENVDNVPLLVSLFTDCTPETTCQMISIMQDYGEVVCVLGSASNILNMGNFLKANASIAIEPLFPEVCVTQPIIEGDAGKTSLSLSPTNLAKQLISLPCSLVLQRDDPIGLHRLIMESRTFMNNIRNSLQFLLCCSLSLSLIQLLASLLFLPPLLTSGQVLWMVFVILPGLSLSLMASPPDPHVMTTATGKNLNLTKESVVYFLFCYLIKFTPSMLLIIFFFVWILTTFCRDRDDSQGWDFFLDFQKGSNPSCLSSQDLLLSQTFVLFLLVLYFIAISMGFVHRCHLFWQRSPFINRCWIWMSVVCLSSHTLFCFGEVMFFVEELNRVSLIPLPLLCLALVWTVILIPLNTLVKRKEIKANDRQQRRARLDFNTKLGMNSPF